MSRTKSYPPVILVSGSEGYFCRKMIIHIRQDFVSKSWSIKQIDGADRDGLLSTVSGSMGFLFDTETLVIVSTQVNKIDPDIVNNHRANPNPSVVILIYHEGKPRKGSVFAKLYRKAPKATKFRFDTPSIYKAPTEATQFCVKEAKFHGRKLDRRLAKALVERAGTDFGVLSYEILKICMLAKIEGIVEIKPGHIAQTISSLVESSVLDLIDAISERQIKRTFSCLERIRRTHHSDPTIKVCRFVSESVLKWLCAVGLDEKKVAPDDAISRMQIRSLWVYNNKFLPSGKRWGRQGLLSLLSVFSESERNVRKGAVDPWSGLLARLMRTFALPVQ